MWFGASDFLQLGAAVLPLAACTGLWSHFSFMQVQKSPRVTLSAKSGLLLLLLLMGKVENELLGTVFTSFDFIAWVGGTQGKESIAWAVEIRFILFLTVSLKRTFLFQELLIRMKKKERKSRGEENILHYPVLGVLCSTSHWENSNRIYSKKAFPMITHSPVGFAGILH